MRVLGSSVLALEAIIVLLGTALASSTGSVSNAGLAWGVGLTLMVLVIASIGTLGSRRGIWIGWAIQVLVIGSSIFVGWAMLIIGVIFAVLWFFAVRLGTRVDGLRESAEQG